MEPELIRRLVPPVLHRVDGLGGGERGKIGGDSDNVGVTSAGQIGEDNAKWEEKLRKIR